MKRLLRISFNQAVFSFMPILSWFMIGIIIDKNLINVFTLTYPIQFIWSTLRAVFATGANICKEKDQNENSVLSGITLGIIFGAIIFGTIVINIEKYINFMNMDVNIYKEFAIYSVIQLYIQLVLSYVFEKLYFENKEKLANKYCFGFNLINFSVLIISSILIKDKMQIVIITLLSILLYTVYVTLKEYRKFKLELNILKYIKYDSTNIFNNILFFIIYLFGLSNALEYGEEYALALNFVALITDTQWDAFEAIVTVAKIDISKRKFNYIEHISNSYKLLIILMFTTIIMFITLFSLYNISILLALIYLSFEIINFISYPIYSIKTCYLQLEYSAKKTTINKIIANILRMSISFIKSPFCTGIGQISSTIYQMITVNHMFNKKFKVENNGEIFKKT